MVCDAVINYCELGGHNVEVVGQDQVKRVLRINNIGENGQVLGEMRDGNVIGKLVGDFLWYRCNKTFNANWC